MRFKRDTLVSYTNTAVHQDSTNFLLDASRFTYNALLVPDNVPTITAISQHLSNNTTEAPVNKDSFSSTIRPSGALPTPETIKLWRDKGCLYERIFNYLKTSKKLLKGESSQETASVNGVFSDDEFESLPSLTEPDAKNIKKWKEIAATKMMGDITCWDLSRCNVDLIDMIEEGEAFTEHSFMDHFLSSVPGEIVVPPSTAALVTSRNDDDYETFANHPKGNEKLTCSAEGVSTSATIGAPKTDVPGSLPSIFCTAKIDYASMIIEQEALRQKVEASYTRYSELMRLFSKDQAKRFERLQEIILPLFSTPEHLDYVLRQQQQLQQEQKSSKEEMIFESSCSNSSSSSSSSSSSDQV